MAEIDPRNVIYNILAGKNELTAETEKSSKAISSLDKIIKDAGVQVEKAFKKGSLSMAQYTKLIKDAGKASEKLAKDIKNQEQVTSELDRKLKQVNKELSQAKKGGAAFILLTRQSKQLTDSLAGANVELDRLKLEKTGIDNASEQLQKMANRADFAGKGLKNLSNEAKGAVSQLGPLGRILATLGPAGIAAGAAIGGLAAGFNLATSRVQAFGDRASIVFAGLKARVNVLKDDIALLFADAFSGEFESAFERLNVLLGLTEGGKQAKKLRKVIVDEIQKRAEELRKLEIKIDETRIDNIERLAELERDAAVAAREFEESKTKGIFNAQALNREEAATNEIYRIRIEEAKELNKLEIERNKLSLSGRKEETVEKQGKAAIILLEAELEAAQKAIERKRKDIVVGLIADLNKEIEKENKKILTATDPLQIKESGRRLKALNDELELYVKLGQRIKDVELFKTINNDVALLNPEDIKGRVTIVQDEIQRLIRALNRLQNEDSTAGKQIKSDIAALKVELAGIDPVLQAIIKSQSNIKSFTIGLDNDEKRQKENIKSIEDAADKILAITFDLSDSILREEQERTDRQIQLAQDRVNAFRALAEKGSAEQLQLEEERLQRLTELREEQARKERIIAAAQIAAANAVTIAKGIQSVISGFSSGNPILGIANAIALAATVGSTILALKNATSSIPAFAEGTEYVKLNGAPKGRDTVLARLDEGERVVPKKQNAMLNGIPNEKLVEAVKYYQFNQRVKDEAVRPSGSNNLPLIQEIRQMREDIRDMQMFLSVNEFGIAAGVQRANTKKKRIKNLARG